MDCIVHGVPKSWTRLSDFHFMWSLSVLIKHFGGSPKCSPLSLGPWHLQEDSFPGQPSAVPSGEWDIFVKQA